MRGVVHEQGGKLNQRHYPIECDEPALSDLPNERGADWGRRHRDVSDDKKCCEKSDHKQRLHRAPRARRFVNGGGAAWVPPTESHSEWFRTSLPDRLRTRRRSYRPPRKKCASFRGAR